MSNNQKSQNEIVKVVLNMETLELPKLRKRSTLPFYRQFDRKTYQNRKMVELVSD